MNKKIIVLLQQMGERLNNENDLSDITLAFMNTVPFFQDLYVEYCFDKKIRVLEIKREYQNCDSRPDFFFYDVDKNKYLIEVKIADRNMHFDQYNKNLFFSECEKSFISNYHWQEEDGWHIKNWKGFYELLRKKKIYFSEDEVSLIDGYLKYLEKVILYEELKSMNISKLDSIYNFYLMIDDVIGSYSKVKFNEYNNSKPCTPDKYGKYVYFDILNESVYFWLGLYFKDITGVYFEFEYKNKNWVPENYSNILEQMGSGEYCECPTNDGNRLWIKLNSKYYEMLCNEKISVVEQRNVIECFFNEVIEKLL